MNAVKISNEEELYRNQRVNIDLAVFFCFSLLLRVLYVKHSNSLLTATRCNARCTYHGYGTWTNI